MTITLHAYNLLIIVAIVMGAATASSLTQFIRNSEGTQFGPWIGNLAFIAATWALIWLALFGNIDLR